MAVPLGIAAVRRRSPLGPVPGLAANRGRRARGLTLVELLVTLVLVSMLGTLLVQSVGFFAGRYEAVQDVARTAARAALRQQWFATSVQGLVPEGVEARRFVGVPAAFQGITLQPLEAASGLPVLVRWDISVEGVGAAAVGYAEDGGPRRRVLARAGALAFQYADASGAWHDRWPPSDSAEWTPSQVRLMAGPETLWLAAVEAAPWPRVTQSALR